MLTLMVASLLISLLLGVSALLIDRARSRADIAFRGAAENAAHLANLLYATDLQLAYQAWDKGWPDQVRTILARQTPATGDLDRRGFEWHLLHGFAPELAAVALAGYQGAIQELAVFPDGRRVATVGADATLRIWDIPERKLLSTISFGSAGLHAIAIAPDGRTIAAGEKTLFLIDVEGKQVRELLQSEATIESLAFSPAGDRIAVGSRYDQVDLVALSGDRITRVPSQARHETIQFMPRGKMFLMPSRQPRPGFAHLGVIELRSEDLTRRMRVLDPLAAGDSRGSYAMAAVSPCERFVAVGDRYQARWAIFAAATGERLAKIPSERSRLTNLAYGPSGGSLAAALQNGTVRIWTVEPRPGERLWVDPRSQLIAAHDGEVTSLRYLDAETLVTGGSDGLLKAWNFRPRSQTLKFGPVDTSIYSVKFSPDGRRLLAVGGANLWIVDSQDGRMEAHHERPGAEFEDAIWSPDGNRVAASISAAGVIEFYDVRQQRVTATLKHGEHVADIGFSPDGNQLISIGWQQVRIWDVRSTLPRTSYPLPEYGWAAQYAHTPHRIAYAGRFGRIVLRDTADDRITGELPCHSHTRCLAFSHDDAVLASGHEDGKIRLWDLPGGTLRAELSGHERPVEQLAFLPDGTALASAGHDGTIRLWSVSMNRAFGVIHRRITAHAVAFSPDGQRLAAGFSPSNERPSGVVWSIPGND